MRKNVVILTPGFPVSEEDTTCIPSLQSLILELHTHHRDSINLHVVAFQYPFISGKYTWHGIPCWSAGGSNKKFPGKWETWLSVMRFLRKLHQQTPIDIVHAFWLNECTLVGKWISKLSGAKLVCHAMGQDVLRSNKYMKYIKPKSLNIIAVSDFAAEKLNSHFKTSNVKVIPNGINADDFRTLHLNDERHTDILGVGSLIPLKNYELFVKLFSELKQIYPALSGRIIGDGPQFALLEKLIAQNQLEKSLLLEGHLSRPDVLHLMTHSKILLHPSLFESAGYVFLEALAAGMKVVSFKTGYLPNVVGAYACDSEEAMRNALKSLLSYKQEYKPVQVIQVSETANAVIEVYKKL
ncbi:MAG: glycosyltransferase family 4 protein [Bacteroidetes bacterium]|nr:glycosyltransferase family 4 protein [Bacteroidota bacterium]